ncbi:MAG: hypothetical protein GY697_23280 [Desulfobacterales bacterium]|nr:hypothetical protein [Desulfobacterales bacterium]
MIDDFQVPDEFLGAFRRLVRKMPVEFQTDEVFLQTLVMYLKLGGEKLASHRIEVEKAQFATAFTIVKRQPSEDAGNTESAEKDSNEDDADDTDEVKKHADDVEDTDPETVVS